MRVEWLEDAAALDQVAPAWEALAGPDALPFERPGWFRAWWAAFGGDGGLAVATGWDGEALTGVLPLRRSGRELHALANDHTPVFRPIGDAGPLFEAALARAGVLSLPALTAAEPSTHELRRLARARRRLALVQEYQRHAIVRTDGSFDGYLASLDRKFRKDLQRRARRAEEEVGWRTILLELPSDEDLTLGFAAEASGWKGERGSAILGDPAAERFYRSLPVELPDAARFSALELEGRYAAFDLSLVGGNRVWLLKGGFDEEFRRFAPGLILTLAQIEAATAAGHEAVELLGQAVSWKLRFANDEREQVFVGVYARSPAAAPRYALRRLRPVARALYRKLPGVEVR